MDLSKNIIVSFVVPVYNVAKYLEGCIKSLSLQKEENIEIILVNDGSTDNSGEICAAYAEKDKRIKYIYQENQGVSVARNRGIDESSGKWICFVDGDDKIAPEFMDVLHEKLKEQVDIIFFDSSEKSKVDFSQGKAVKAEKIFAEQDFAMIQRCTLNRFLSDYYFCPTWGKLFKREFIEKFNIRYAPGVKKSLDVLFSLESYIHAKSCIYVQRELYYYNVNAESVSRRYVAGILESQLDLIERYYNIIEQSAYKHVLREDMKVTIARLFMAALQVNLCHPDNPETYAVRKKKFKAMKIRTEYKEALKNADMSMCRKSERILQKMIEVKCFGLINILFKIRSILIKIKSK